MRGKDLPPPEPASPTEALEEKKAAIYENLRDLQFEYRVGKLSDDDYQRAKLDLQRELAVRAAEDRPPHRGRSPKPVAATPRPAPPPGIVCPNCGARFPQPMKFCGECGASHGRRRGDENRVSALPGSSRAPGGRGWHGHERLHRPASGGGLRGPGRGERRGHGSRKRPSPPISAGKFRFTETPLGPALLQATHQGVTYNLMVQPGAPSTGLTLEVFDASTKPGAAKVIEDVVLLEPLGAQLSVRENVIWQNGGKLTYP